MDDVVSDLVNMRALASADHLVIMNDTPCTSPFCQGPNIAWGSGEHNGTIRAYHRAFFSDPIAGVQRGHGISLGMYPAIIEPDGLEMSKARGLSFADLGMPGPGSPGEQVEELEER